MDDEFELRHADELEAMQDCVDGENIRLHPDSRRSLHFITPKKKAFQGSDECAGLHRSFLIPPDSPEAGTSAAEKTRQAHLFDSEATSCESLKRGREEECHCLSGGDEEARNDCAVPKIKKPRTDCPIFEDVAESLHQTKQRKQSESYEQYQTRLVDDYKLERRRVFRRIPRGGSYVGVTATDGRKAYMHVNDESDVQGQLTEVYSTKMLYLLGTPFATLIEQAERERHKKLTEEAELISEDINRQLEDDPSSVKDDEDKENCAPRVAKEPGTELWVEKYMPRTYTELLSEEVINRTLLYWVKLWDHVVFRKEIKVKKKAETKGKAAQKKRKRQLEVTDELDRYNRPLQKVALLSGPPGLGKTTLAHVVACHAGYNVVEMNASDNRSAELFKNKVDATVQMKAVIGLDPRPNCLIIDEIDGAPQAAISILLDLIKKPEASVKKKKEGDILLRPIICICNDQYVPALRLLRQNALVMTFPPTEPTRLASRLYQVVKWEYLKADMNALLMLCEKTDNDIRSCLNTLQFVQHQHEELTLKMVHTMNVGEKDAQKSLFAAWLEIFRMPQARRSKYLSVQHLQDKSMMLQHNTTMARFQKVLSLAQAVGEYEKIMQGLFENYLAAKFKDPRMEGINLANDWLCFIDHSNAYVASHQDYSLMRYFPFLPVTFHFLFASNTPTRIQYPHSQSELIAKQSKAANLVMSMLTDMQPSIRKFLNFSMLVLDILQPLLDILQPSLRPVNTQLYSAREKQDLKQLVQIMIAYNMTYRQERLQDGQYSYVLEPNMEDVVRFPTMKQHKQLPYAAKQLIAREIEMEKMRWAEAALTGKFSESDRRRTSTVPAAPNHKRKIEPKPLGTDTRETLDVDFFGRAIKKNETATKPSAGGKTSLLASDIWFHFKVGYSNAVRRSVKVQDLL